jgi:catalase
VELKERLANGTVMFDFVAIMGKAGDQTSDPTLRWDDEDNRPTTLLGKISITAMAPQENCDVGLFLPTNVTDGIVGPTDDPIFAARLPAYFVLYPAECCALMACFS